MTVLSEELWCVAWTDNVVSVEGFFCSKELEFNIHISEIVKRLTGDALPSPHIGHLMISYSLRNEHSEMLPS